MAKKIKMVLYGEPGVGKSVFACKAPKPFFICTDGNYEWLEDFGAKEEDHVRVFSWKDAKKQFSKSYDNYETIVVDLTEDLFKWCEYEFCEKEDIEHVGDLGYGKGYDITRNEFFIEISKLLNLNKNIILIMHGTTTVVKDRKGIEHYKHIPSPRIPDKVLDMIEGRVRYFLRCYLKGEEVSNNSIVKKRYLSLVPKENEFGIIRGVDENTIPQDIELDWNVFYNTVFSKNEIEETKVEDTKVGETKIEEAKVEDSLEVEEVEISETEEKTNETIDMQEEQKPLTQAEKLARLKVLMNKK